MNEVLLTDTMELNNQPYALVLNEKGCFSFPHYDLNDYNYIELIPDFRKLQCSYHVARSTAKFGFAFIGRDSHVSAHPTRLCSITVADGTHMISGVTSYFYLALKCCNQNKILRSIEIGKNCIPIANSTNVIARSGANFNFAAYNFQYVHGS